MEIVVESDKNIKLALGNLEPPDTRVLMVLQEEFEKCRAHDCTLTIEFEDGKTIKFKGTVNQMEIPSQIEYRKLKGWEW